MNIWTDINLPKIGINRTEELERILSEVCKETGIPIYLIRGSRKFEEIVSARVKFAKRAYKKGFKLVEIGNMISRGHDTIHHYLNNYTGK